MSTTYTFAGFTFTFNLDGSGNVFEIITPAITIAGIGILGSTLISLDPSQTVPQAQEIVRQFLAKLGITG